MSTADHVAAAIRRYADEHGLRAGDRLPPEREFAQALGVSRPALREATRRLVDVGMLRSRQGSGTYLAEVDLGELLAVRERLEPLAAELAAAAADARQRDGLRALAARLAATIDDAEAFAAADLEIHAAIAAASGNRVLVRVLDDLDALLRIARSRTAAAPATRARSLGEVTALVDAVCAGDAAAAGAAMREHLRSIGRAAGR